MIITDKDEYMHIVNEQKILFALFHIPTVAIHIYFENCSPKDKLKIFFNTREEAEAVLRQIDERMEHPLREFCTRESVKYNMRNKENATEYFMRHHPEIDLSKCTWDEELCQYWIPEVNTCCE